METIAERFTEFCRSIPGAEELDAMSWTQEQLRLKRADFLFDQRSIICEIKTLESDTAAKFISFLKQEGFDLAPGQYSVQALLATRPNGNALFAKATNLIATAVADGLAEANRQIAGTKELLGLSATDGVVVILNDLVEILGPQVVIKRCLERLEKLEEDGQPYHANIALILYFSEKHLREVAGGQAAVTFQLYNQHVTALHDLNAFSTQFIEGWARFNGRTYEEQTFEFR